MDSNCGAYVCTDGTVYAVPENLVRLEEGVRLAQQAVSRREPGSNRHRRALEVLAKRKAKQTRVRKDWLDKVTYDLATRADVVVLEDRKGRTRVIAAGLVVWSGFTALCGLAGNFTQLFLSRLGVGIGEAGGVAPSYAIIAERFPSHSRAQALAIYGLGVPMGSALGALGGAAIAQAVDWRAAFIVLGLAGLLAVIPFRLIVRDLPRAPEAEKTPPTAVFGRLARQLPGHFRFTPAKDLADEIEWAKSRQVGPRAYGIAEQRSDGFIVERIRCGR